MGNCVGRQRRATREPQMILGADELFDSLSDTPQPEDEKGSCPICFEEKKLSCFYNPESNENFRITPCNHRFCEECFSTHVNTVVDSGSWQVRCPGESCNYVLSAKDVQRILTDSKYEEWQAARNKSYYERFMSNDQEMRDALKVDRLVAKEIKKRKMAEKAKILDGEEKTVKIDGVELKHGLRVLATYLGRSGLMYNGTIFEVDVQNRTASIAYDDGGFWGFAPFTSIRIPRSNTRRRRRCRRLGRNRHPFLDEDFELETLKEEDIVEGKRVMARLRGSNETFYPGIITSVNKKKKTASIEYDDGDVWEICPFHQIREGQSNLKCCPQCAVIIHKYDGCDSMTCLCGERFNWTNCHTIPPKLMDKLVETETEKTRSA